MVWGRARRPAAACTARPAIAAMTENWARPVPAAELAAVAAAAGFRGAVAGRRISRRRAGLAAARWAAEDVAR